MDDEKVATFIACEIEIFLLQFKHSPVPVIMPFSTKTSLLTEPCNGIT
jgi:hypothetical protein